MMPSLSSVVKRRPLLTFFVLALALSWWGWILYAIGLSPTPIASFGPFLAALVVLGVTRGRTGMVGLLSRMVRWRVGFRWYAVALLLPVGVALVATLSNVFLLGAPAPSSAELGGWSNLFTLFPILLLIPGMGGAWEEPGWRGFALPSLQTGRSALVASLILGVMWAFWHLPLLMTGQMGGWDIVNIMGSAIVLTWVFNSTGGSVLIVMLFHAMNNTISGHFFSRMFSGADSVSQSLLLAAAWCAVALVVVVVTGPEHLSRKHPKQKEEEKAAAEPGVATPRAVTPTSL
jgi:membrane protease YdiL (CAAX protease family)